MWNIEISLVLYVDFVEDFMCEESEMWVSLNISN